MPQDKSSSAVAKGLKMTKFGSNAATVVEKASNIISSAKNNKDGSAGGDRNTGDQSIATSNTTSGTSSCHHHYHHHYPPKHRRTASGQFDLFSNFSCMFLNPDKFFQFEFELSNLSSPRNLKEHVKKVFCYQKIVVNFHCLNKFF